MKPSRRKRKLLKAKEIANRAPIDWLRFAAARDKEASEQWEKNRPLIEVVISNAKLNAPNWFRDLYKGTT